MKLIADPETRQLLGEPRYHSLTERVELMEHALETGGAQNAFQFGQDMGELIWDTCTAVISTYGTVKGGAELAKVGFKLGATGVRGLAASAANVATRSLNRAAAGSGVKAVKAPSAAAKGAGLPARVAGKLSTRGLATAAKQGTTAPVPKVPSKVAGVSDKMAAGNSLSKAGPVAATSPVSSSAVLKQPPKVTNKAPCRVDQTTTAKSTRQLETANKVTNFNVIDLIASAKKPVNEQGLSVAARAWEKHAGRPASLFKALNGNPAQKNAIANKFINEVLNNKNTMRTVLSRGGVEYRLPDGSGIRYNADGSFSGFVDPKRTM